MSVKAETRIISVLLSELSQKFGVSVNTKPSLECGGVTPVKMHMPGRLIIVGASHMVRLAKHLPNTTISLAYPGSKATPQALTQIVSGLEELRLNKDNSLILDLLSNSSFKGTDEEGLPTPATAGEGGTYHIPGSLVASPGPAIKKILGNCQRLGKLCATCHQVTLVAPILRYVTSRCCNNQNHVENYDSEDFEAEIIAGIEMHKKLLKGLAIEHNLNFGMIDTTELVDPVELVLRNRLTHGGIPLWTMWDPVHLVEEAYQEMAEAILLPGIEDADSTEPGSAISSESLMGGHKRRRSEAVIIGQPVQPAKKGKPGSERQPAGWLQGKAEWGRARLQTSQTYTLGQQTERPSQCGRWAWPRRSWPSRRPGTSRGRGWTNW
jgi:hypothetical protein